jgi:DNA-directed RNA polymerase subunit RPC12/RpoP
MHGRMVPIATPETSMAEKGAALMDFLRRYVRQFMQPCKPGSRAKGVTQDGGNGKHKDKDKAGKDKPRDAEKAQAPSRDEVAERFAALYQTRQFVCAAPEIAIEGANPELKPTKELAPKADSAVRDIAALVVASRRSFWQELLGRLRREPPASLTRQEFYKMAQWLADQDQAPAPVSTVTKLLSERCRTMPPALLAAIRQVQRDASWNPEDGNAASDTLCILHFCAHCQSDDLCIAGTDGEYRFFCRTCEKLTPLDPICSDCGGATQLTRAHRTFFVRCKDCGHERVFFVNPPEPPAEASVLNGGAVVGRCEGTA